MEGKEVSTSVEKSGKKKLIKWIILVVAVVVAVAVITLITMLDGNKTETKVITTAQLEKVLDVDELSTGKFVYNGIAQAYEKDNPDKLKYNVKYEAAVKAGVDASEISFKVDNEKKTIIPYLPKIRINSVEVDVGKLSFIPNDVSANPKEAIQICEKDALDEANANDQLVDTGTENLKAEIEALLLPLAQSNDYTIEWPISEEGEN